MNILEPKSIEEIPAWESKALGGKYPQIVEKVNALKANEWLPISFNSKAEAVLGRAEILQASRDGRGRKHPIRLTSHVVGSVLYLRKKEEVKAE